MIVIEDKEAAWQAGITDGEGTFTITKQESPRAPFYRAFVCITNTNQEILSPFILIWGGKIHKKRRRGAREQGWRLAYTWVCPTATIPVFLLAICPYMRTKAEQISLITKLLANKAEIGHMKLSAEVLDYRESLYLRSRQLNAKGVTAEEVKRNES